MTKNSKIEQGKNLAKLSQVKTFSRLTGSDNIDTSRLKGMMGAWCNNFLPGKIRIFLFKFYNNIPGLNYRVPAAKFNILTDPSCTFCSSSNFPAGRKGNFCTSVLLLLTNSRKGWFAAGALKGPFPVAVQLLDSATETDIITSLCKELNDSYCLSLPAAPAHELGSESQCLVLEGKRMVVIGSSHAGKLSALLAASLETKFKKLPPQSQTPEAAENLADKLLQFDLTENDIVYLDLLSNQVYLGTDEEGNSTDPYNDSQNR